MSRPDRIWRTADGRYVGDGHIDAEILAAGPADPAPDDFDLASFEPGPVVAADQAADHRDSIEPVQQPSKRRKPSTD